MKRILLILIVSTQVCFSQNFNYLGTYTSNGTPLYLENPGDVISAKTQEMISNSLPEGYPVPDYNPHYISSGYDTDLILDDDADVWVTFVSEGAGYKNVLGYYTYDANSTNNTKPIPEDITIIFPNVSAINSGGGLRSGDKVKIGTFKAGTGIGWVLLANAWNGRQVTWGLWQLYSNINYNPESQQDLKYHNVLLSDPENERIILGFEDIRRDYASCDNDFNDAIFYVTANPFSAIRSDNYADVSSATNVTSANKGGLESNGNLAGLIAKRNFKRQTSGNLLDKRSSQKNYSKSNTGKSDSQNMLEKYLPETGMFGNETAYISSPEDLLGITNAQDVFSIDIYQDNKRVSAALATKTEGFIYNHSKVICDRLNNSSLEDIRTVSVRGHNIISSKIKRATGEIEYTLSFSVKLGTDSNEVFSFWNVDQYPQGNYNNFQIWGSSFSQVFAVANHILDTFSAEKSLVSTPVNDKIPSVFVKSGYYSKGNIHLNIVNKTGAKNIIFNGNTTATEVSERINNQQTLALTGNYNENITISTGSLFDIGFSLATESSVQKDALYLADGPWGIDYLSDYATVDVFQVDNKPIAYDENIYEVERQPTVSGLVKGNVNLFRHLLPGELSLDVLGYNAIQFNIVNNEAVELVLMPEELTDWNNRLRYTIPANNTETFHSISFSDFKDANGKSASISNIKTVVFSVINDYTNYKPYNMAISNLAFSNQTSLSTDTVIALQKKISLTNYPNPFKTNTTIKLATTTKFVNIMVFDMSGRTVDIQHIANNSNRLTYNAPSLSKGVYKYMLVNDVNQTYTGTFLIE
ncbi:DUF4114 domain-containing protein [Flavobacteriaceae bacterium XHP0103]|uniref:DUF4114 domain-containing protein n=1 Tax=Marixanthotalea marina TaxID=2844359 RepID=UPI00298A02BC|nr:DUF4114 domain-containing protein [Marixanthotalea marina]MBU3821267.1 DUF4114 domain-containing protein [Marixanthotalea marina]